MFTHAMCKHKQAIEKQRIQHQQWLQWKHQTGGWEDCNWEAEQRFRSGPEVVWPSRRLPLCGNFVIQNRWPPCCYPLCHEGGCMWYSRAPKAGRQALMASASRGWPVAQCQEVASQRALDQAVDDGCLSDNRFIEAAIGHAQQAARAAWNHCHGYDLYNPAISSHHKMLLLHIELTCPLCCQLLAEPLTINVAHHLLKVQCSHSFCQG